LIDSAILRPGRFDFILEFPLPDEKARLEIFKVHTRGKPLASDVDLPALAQKTEGMAGSDIAAICQEASMIAIRKFIKVGHEENKLQIAPKEEKSGKTLKDSIEFAAKLQISREHFDLAIQWLKGQKGE
jgi:transitional endoplasmic reticulum ATPase